MARHEPQIATDAFVAPGSHLIGKVVLGARVSIWFGAVLRGDNEPIAIGASSNVQENCVLHTDPGFPLTIGAGVTVGHQAMLHGCTIGDFSLIGIQAIVMNGATIGRECLVAAGALVTEGKSFPDRSLIMAYAGEGRASADRCGSGELARGFARVRRARSALPSPARQIGLGYRYAGPTAVTLDIA